MVKRTLTDDWYLAVSTVSEFPLPEGENPLTEIGLDLSDGTLCPGQNRKVIALVDFEHPAHPQERTVQLEALRLNIAP